jgi:hypothetical protein
MKKLLAGPEANEDKPSDLISYKGVQSRHPSLNAVLKEPMRIYPSVGLLLKRHDPARGATICREQTPENI